MYRLLNNGFWYWFLYEYSMDLISYTFIYLGVMAIGYFTGTVVLVTISSWNVLWNLHLTVLVYGYYWFWGCFMETIPLMVYPLDCIFLEVESIFHDYIYCLQLHHHHGSYWLLWDCYGCLLSLPTADEWYAMVLNAIFTSYLRRIYISSKYRNSYLIDLELNDQEMGIFCLSNQLI